MPCLTEVLIRGSFVNVSFLPGKYCNIRAICIECLLLHHLLLQVLGGKRETRTKASRPTMSAPVLKFRAYTNPVLTKIVEPFCSMLSGTAKQSFRPMRDTTDNLDLGFFSVELFLTDGSP